MTNFDRLIATTNDLYEECLGRHAILPLVTEGKMTQEHYIAYLRETYHMVRHTSRMLSLAAARCEDERRGLRDWLIEQTSKENGHDLYCMRDLETLGIDVPAVLSAPPLSGAWGLICQNYFMATYGDPIGILGVASITEGLGASIAGGMEKILTTKYGYEPTTTTFLRSHSGFDVKHLEETEKAINDFVRSEDDRRAVTQGREMTIIYYAQMFTDCLEQPYRSCKADQDRKTAAEQEAA